MDINNFEKSLYVLVQTDVLSTNGAKHIIGIYDWDMGHEKIKQLESMNMERSYKLEGPFKINQRTTFSDLPPPVPDFLPLPNPDIFPKLPRIDSNDPNFTKFTINDKSKSSDKGPKSGFGDDFYS